MSSTPIIKSYVLICFAFLPIVFGSLSSTRQFTPSTCTKPSPSEFTFGGCPGKCAPYTVDLSTSCAEHLPSYCLLQPCHDSHSSFKCSFSYAALENIVVCPHDTLVFDRLQLSKLSSISYSFDAQVPKENVPTDVFFLIDATKRVGVSKILARSIVESGVKETTSFGVAYFTDGKKDVSPYVELQPISNNKTNTIASLVGIERTRRLKNSQSSLFSLSKVASSKTIHWRSYSKRVVVLLTSSSGYEPTCVDGKDETRADVIEELNKAGITVVVVDIDGRADTVPDENSCEGGVGDATAEGQGSDLALGTEGVKVSNSVEEILNAIEDISDVEKTSELSVETSHCEGAVNIIGDNLPETVRSGMVAPVSTVLTVTREVCKKKGSLKCFLEYKLDGAPFTSVGIELRNTRGCRSWF